MKITAPSTGRLSGGPTLSTMSSSRSLRAFRRSLTHSGDSLWSLGKFIVTMPYGEVNNFG